MNISLDWLSVTVRTAKDVNIPVIELMAQVVDLMHLRDYYKKAVVVGSDKFYGAIYRIDDISFKLGREKDGACANQGVMVEMTSNGLCKYIHFLNENKLCLTDVLRDLRALCMAGYVVNYPRLDVALDDVHFNNSRPILYMSKIIEAWTNHLFCSRARAHDGTKKRNFDENEDFGVDIKTGKICYKRKRDLLGKTVYFGSRKSAVCVRFYDKLVEQKQNGREVPEDITHWVRCEYEFHKERACAVVAMLIDNDWDGFVKSFCRCVLGHLRFINCDDCNRSRCSTCSWWTKFLNGIMSAEKFTIPAKKPVSADNTIRWLRRSVFPSLYAYIVTAGMEEMVNEVIDSKERLGYKQLQFISDFVDCDNDTDDTSALYNIIFWACLSCRSITEVLDDIRKDYDNLQLCQRYRSQIYGSTDTIIKAVLGLVD